MMHGPMKVNKKN